MTPTARGPDCLDTTETGAQPYEDMDRIIQTLPKIWRRFENPLLVTAARLGLRESRWSACRVPGQDQGCDILPFQESRPPRILEIGENFGGFAERLHCRRGVGNPP